MEKENGRRFPKKGFNMKIFFRLLVLIIVVIVILFIVPDNFPLETLLQWNWKTTITNKQKEYPPLEGELPFSLNCCSGYIDSYGNVRYRINTVYKASVAQSSYIVYNQVSEVSVIFDQRGKLKGRVSLEGYPFYQDNKLFLLSPRGTNLYRVDATNGRVLWSYASNVPITRLVSQKDLVLIVTLTGNILQPSGKDLFPSINMIQPIHSIAVSEDALRLFVYRGGENKSFGKDKETAHIYALDDKATRQIASFDIDDPTFSYHPAVFLDNNKVVFATHSRLYAVSQRGTVFQKNMRGDVMSIKKLGAYILVIHRNSQNMIFSVWMYPLVRIFQMPLPENISFFAVKNDKIYLGYNKTIIQFELIYG